MCLDYIFYKSLIDMVRTTYLTRLALVSVLVVSFTICSCMAAETEYTKKAVKTLELEAGGKVEVGAVCLPGFKPRRTNDSARGCKKVRTNRYNKRFSEGGPLYRGFSAVCENTGPSISVCTCSTTIVCTKM